VADDHWGLLGEPPSEVFVAVSAPDATSFRELLAAASRWRARLLIVVATIAALATVAMVVAMRGGEQSASASAPLGGPLRCLNASTLCVTRGLFPHQAPGGSN
jgi:hypothetical protein